MEKALSPVAMPHVLVVDDDDRLRTLLAKFLGTNGFIVSTSCDAANARAKLRSLAYDLVVLDIMMPGETGLALARSLRESTGSLKKIPILFLTARSDPQERIEGLETGADDYLSKPFEPRELLLRLHAVLRRTRKDERSKEKTFRLGKWLYEPERDILRHENETQKLTGMEAGLLRVLAANPGEALSRELLAERSGGGAVNDRTIDVQVTRLRRKIEDDPRTPKYLVTVRGEGYRLVPDEAS